MLITSTASEISSSPSGSRANSIPCNNARPLQLVDTELQTFTAYRLASGATPLCDAPSLPAMISATCVPCPPLQGAAIAAGPQSIGSGSGAKGPLGHISPTKSNPPTTLSVGNKPSVDLFLGSATPVPYAARYASAVPGPPKNLCV